MLALCACLAGCAAPYKDAPRYRPAALERRGVGSDPTGEVPASQPTMQTVAAGLLNLDECVEIAKGLADVNFTASAYNAGGQSSARSAQRSFKSQRGGYSGQDIGGVKMGAGVRSRCSRRGSTGCGR